MAKYRNPSDRSLQQYELQRSDLPCYVILFSKEGKVDFDDPNAQLQFSVFPATKNYYKLAEFLRPFEQQKEEEDEEMEFANTNEITEFKDLHDQCTHLDFGSNVCIFLLFDGSINQEYLYKNHLKPFFDIVQAYKNTELNFGTIDGKCHSEFLEYFGVNEILLPVVVAYNPVKQHIASGKIFDEEHLKSFLTNVETRKVRTFKKEVKLQDSFKENECEQYYRDLNIVKKSYSQEKTYQKKLQTDKLNLIEDNQQKQAKIDRKHQLELEKRNEVHEAKMKEWNDAEAEKRKKERENAPDNTIRIDHWQGNGDGFNGMMAGKQYEARKEHEYDQQKAKWAKKFGKKEEVKKATVEEFEQDENELL